jgi:N-acetylmuramoyl-L-alanine amidase
MHHNAGINGGSGGGVVAFSYPGSSKGKQYRDAIYEAVIGAGGLKGNRSQPLQEKKFDSLRYANAPAVLMEYGFMDSTTDVPVILTDAYSELVAYATMEGIAQVAGLKKKPAAPAVKHREGCTVELEMLEKGSWGGPVKAMQMLLIGNGCPCGATGADGDFGANTDVALRLYQKSKGLTADGICGEKTWRKLLGMK